MRFPAPISAYLSCHAEFISAYKTKKIIDSENPEPCAELDSVLFQNQNDIVKEHYIALQSILARLELQHII